MKVEFTRSGGFANIAMTVTLDTASMAAASATDLEAKVAAAGFFDLPPTIGDSAHLRDAHHYIVTITTPERHHTVAIAGAAPPAVQALIDQLTRAARDTRAAGGRSTA